jgi:hypothetical protein
MQMRKIKITGRIDRTRRITVISRNIHRLLAPRCTTVTGAVHVIEVTAAYHLVGIFGIDDDGAFPVTLVTVKFYVGELGLRSNGSGSEQNGGEMFAVVVLHEQSFSSVNKDRPTKAGVKIFSNRI